MARVGSAKTNNQDLESCFQINWIRERSSFGGFVSTRDHLVASFISGCVLLLEIKKKNLNRFLAHNGQTFIVRVKSQLARASNEQLELREQALSPGPEHRDSAGGQGPLDEILRQDE